MATGVLEALHELGKKVPKEVQVVSTDNSPTGLYTIPKLSSFDMKALESGRLAAEMLFDLMDGRPVRRVTLAPELVQRESTRNLRLRTVKENVSGKRFKKAI